MVSLGFESFSHRTVEPIVNNEHQLYNRCEQLFKYVVMFSPGCGAVKGDQTSRHFKNVHFSHCVSLESSIGSLAL